MGLKRLKYYSTNEHTPMKDFLAEYYYSQLQDSMQYVNIALPEKLYNKRKDLPIFSEQHRFYNEIILVKDSTELSRILEHNETMANKNDSNKKIITPVIMTIEGGQVLYGPISGRGDHIGEPNKDGKDSALIRKELLDNVFRLKNLPHRLFFITIAHFTQNHVVGYAKTLDRDPENFQHRFPSFISGSSKIRNNIIKKSYGGFNNVNKDSLGFKIVEAFLDPNKSKSKYGKATYIDVKHMDIKARIEYYYTRRKLEKKFGIPIPIVASHFAVSGERQAMAAATGLWPNFDRYQETENPKEFYESYILKNQHANRRKNFWRDVMEGNGFNRKALNPFEKAMYKPLNFRDATILTRDTIYDPFEFYDLGKDPSAGWFYNWSLNLFDEEIIEINKSDGIIGLLLDPRQLGAFAPKYKEDDYEEKMKKAFKATLSSLIEQGLITEQKLKALHLTKDDLKPIEYLKAEPLLRNIFYIVRLTSYQKDGEAHPEKQLNEYKDWYVDDTAKLKKDP
jgi:hypothetical protein